MGAPVNYTCPEIDKIIEYIKKAMKIANDGKKEFPDANVEFHDIYYYLDGCENMLEDLRKANASLRNWGDELEKHLASQNRQRHAIEQAYFAGFNQAHYSHVHPEAFPVKECETAAAEYMNEKFPGNEV